MLVSPNRQGADYDFHQDRRATRTERYKTYELYGQAQQLPLRHTYSDLDQQLAREITNSIKRGVPLDSTPAELLLTDREKVQGQASLGRSYSDRQTADKMSHAIRHSQSLGDLWQRADWFEKEQAEDLQESALRKLSKSPLIDLNDLLVNALLKKHFHNIKPLVELGADANALLKVAALQGKTDFIEPLLDAGVQVNHENRMGWNATTLAALQGQSESVKLLKKNGYNDFSRVLVEEVAPDMLKDSEKHKKLAIKKPLGELPLGVHFPEKKAAKKSLDLQA